MKKVNFRNDVEIQLYGLQRSGNHAIAAWLCQQFQQPVVFLNNVGHFADPYTSWKYTEMPNTVVLPMAPGLIGRPRALWLHGATSRPKEIEALRRAHKPSLMYSYENLVLARLANTELVPDHAKKIGSSKAVIRVLIVRDFYNWLASRIRLFETRRFDAGQLLRVTAAQAALWIAYAREFLGETAFLNSAAAITVKVNYLKWVKEPLYRGSLLDGTGLKVTDNSIDTVPIAGGGSSFDQTALNGRAAAMQTGERWRYLEQDRWLPLLESLRPRYQVINDLNARAFGNGANPPLTFFADV